MQTIAITGGTGFIGRYLIRELLKDDEIQIRCLTRRTKIEDAIRHKNLEYVLAGSGTEELTELLCGCDAVVHMGGCVPTQGVSDEAFSNECIGTISYAKNLFDACVSNGITNVVLASTIAVYGKGDGTPFSESQRCDPANVYGITKLTIEKFARYYHEQAGLNVKALRISQVYGARKEIKRPFLRMLYENCISGKPVTVFRGERETAVDYVYVRDVCRAFILALRHPEVFGEFNVGSGRHVSVSELAQAYCEGFQNPAGITYVENWNGEVFYNALDLEQSEHILGYAPQFSLQTACQDMCETYKNNDY